MRSPSPTTSTTRPASSKSSTRRRFIGDERGASEAFIVIMFGLLLGFIGLTYDVGMAFNTKREATNIAKSAARAGANTVSTDGLYETGVARMADSATGVAKNAALAAGADDARARTQNERREIIVEVEMSYETIFLKLVGIDDYEVEVEGRAFVNRGVEGP